MTPRARAGVVLLALAALSVCAAGQAAGLAVVSRSPVALTVRLDSAEPGRLYRVSYDDGRHRFVWENLAPDGGGLVTLADDRHLRPEHRLRCESRVSRTDPVVFDDVLKGPVVGKRRLQHGVPVGTFGGPGYLVPGASDLKRDDFGNFWLYLDHPPYAVLKYDPRFEYQFALLTPDRVSAHDTDADGNVYLLHPGNWVSKHGPLGNSLGAWDLPPGRDLGEFASASGLVIDRRAGLIYIADEILGRVQRFGLDLNPRPHPRTAWGWIGHQDLTLSKPGKYDPDTMEYQLDRPRQLALDGKGHLFVSCEHYISKFDLATAKQLPFGSNPVLGWGGTFTDNASSSAAALNGHWQKQWLAGVDAAGNIYVADRENEFLVDRRLQLFSPDGMPLATFDVGRPLTDASGRPVYVTAIMGAAFSNEAIWLVDAAGRVYESPKGSGLVSGGTLHLGAGAAGRQFDLSAVDESRFSVEAQPGRARHEVEGLVLGFPTGDVGTGNCEREGRPQLDDGERSLWMPARLGEPFTVTLIDTDGAEIPASKYTLEIEEKPGLFSGSYDFFRVTNRSGHTWQSARFLAKATGQ